MLVSFDVADAICPSTSTAITITLAAGVDVNDLPHLLPLAAAPPCLFLAIADPVNWMFASFLKKKRLSSEMTLPLILSHREGYHSSDPITEKVFVQIKVEVSNSYW